MQHHDLAGDSFNYGLASIIKLTVLAYIPNAMHLTTLWVTLRDNLVGKIMKSAPADESLSNIGANTSPLLPI